MKDYTLLNDSELLSLVWEDNHLAFTEIYRRYNGLLFLHACRMLGNAEDAKDLVQDLFVNVWNRRFEIEIRTSLSAYLYTSVRNRILDHISKEKNHYKYLASLAEFIEQGECITDYSVREKELSNLIESEVAKLPEKMREIFEMSRKRFLSHKEIADELNLSDKTVKKQISNALIILRKKIEISLLLILTSL